MEPCAARLSEPAAAWRLPPVNRPGWIMHKRSVFHHRVLPYALLAPQLAVSLVFFYWPAGQAVWQSFLLQDAFGLSTSFIWFENYRELFSQPDYYRTVATTFVFS